MSPKNEGDYKRSKAMSGIQALQRLIDVAQKESGQPDILRLFLLSLYNGTAFPLTPYRLKSLDMNLREDVLEVMRLDLIDFPAEIHRIIPGTEHLWVEWREWYKASNGGKNF